MSTNAMIIAIVAIIAWAIVRSNQYRHGGGKPGRRNQGTEPDQLAPSAREIELQHEVEELRERIHVLERIATEDRQPRRLAAEIENLRDS